MIERGFTPNTCALLLGECRQTTDLGRYDSPGSSVVTTYKQNKNKILKIIKEKIK